MAKEVKNVTFGGSMVRDMGALPGLMDKFVTASRDYPKKAFTTAVREIEKAFSHTNATRVEDDHGTIWEPGSLLHLGSDGKDYGNRVVMVHKFIPIGQLYTAVSFDFLQTGKNF